MILVILASGFGSRLMPFTKEKPKCMVEFKNKPIIEYLTPAFKDFKDVICVSGYRGEVLKEYLKKYKNIRFVENTQYATTNMVHSLFCAKDYINQDVIITYSDIIYNTQILKDLQNSKGSVIPLNKNWLETWRKRMPIEEVYKDAENVVTGEGKLISIGGKLSSEEDLPKYQYMGILKLTPEDFTKLSNFYFRLKNFKIDMTTFLNVAIAENIISEINILESEYSWIEIDSLKDLQNLQK